MGEPTPLSVIWPSYDDFLIPIAATVSLGSTVERCQALLSRHLCLAMRGKSTLVVPMLASPCGCITVEIPNMYLSQEVVFRTVIHWVCTCVRSRVGSHLCLPLYERVALSHCGVGDIESPNFPSTAGECSQRWPLGMGRLGS